MKLLATVASLLLLATGEPATLWRYTDEKGAVHFVADRKAIPADHRDAAREVAVTTVTDADEPISPTARLPRPGSAPLIMLGGKPAAKVRFGPGVERTLVLDTGAGFTMVTTKLANALGVDLAHARTGRFATPSGSVTAPVIVIHRLTIGPATLRNVTAAVIDHDGRQDYAGLIGMNALSKFVFTIDPAGGKIVFEGMAATDRRQRR